MKCFGILLYKEMKWGLLQEFKDLSAGSMRICSLLQVFIMVHDWKYREFTLDYRRLYQHSVDNNFFLNVVAPKGAVW